MAEMAELNAMLNSSYWIQNRTRLSLIGGVAVLCFVILIGYYLRFRWHRRKLYELMAKIPGNPGLPIFGNVFEFAFDDRDKLIPKLCDQYRKYGSPFKLWMGPDAAVGICTPDQMCQVLTSPHTLNKGYRLAHIGRSIIGDGIFFSSVHKWKPRRKLIASTFSPKIVESFIPIFIKQTEILIRKFNGLAETGEIFDAWDPISRLSLDAICGTALGVELNSQTTDSSYLSAAKEILELVGYRIFKTWTYIDFLFDHSHLGRRLRINKKLMQVFTEKIIMRKKTEISKQETYNIEDIGYGKNPNGRAFLDYILELTRFDSSFTINDIKDEVDIITIAGFETTANTICFCLVMLALHPKYQAKCYDEVFSIFGNSDRKFEHDDLRRTPYLTMFIQETLRRFPTAFMFLRSTDEEVQVGDKLIPAGATLGMLVYLLHHDPNYWKDPLIFDPDRFLPEEVAKRHPYSYLPFAAGPRNCVGLRYAMMSMKIYLSYLIRNYKISSDLTMDTINLEFGSTLKIKNGYRIQLEKRI